MPHKIVPWLLCCCNEVVMTSLHWRFLGRVKKNMPRTQMLGRAS